MTTGHSRRAHCQSVAPFAFTNPLLFFNTRSRFCFQQLSTICAESPRTLHTNTSPDIREQKEENASQEGSEAGEGPAWATWQQLEEWDRMYGEFVRALRVRWEHRSD